MKRLAILHHKKIKMQEENIIDINGFDYNLLDERIARYGSELRDESKLLIFNNNSINESRFYSIHDYLEPNSCIVTNNSKVIPARIHFKKTTGATIEVFCLEPHLPKDYSLSLNSIQRTQWICMIGNLKKWRGESLSIALNEDIELTATRIAEQGRNSIVEFYWNANISFYEILLMIAELPIPPYLERKTEKYDYERYQTIYSLTAGSVAAPTAGLHFTERVFENIKKKNIEKLSITLHVGAGTFLPVKTQNALEHLMHQEYFSISLETIEKLINSNHISAVGTTTARTLESLYWCGVKLIEKKSNPHYIEQFYAKESHSKCHYKQAYKAVIDQLLSENIKIWNAATSIMIYPGYNFNVIDSLITNFHQPKSTLLMLISAFIGDEWKNVYTYALNNNFRFLSYGDSSLLFKKKVDQTS